MSVGGDVRRRKETFPAMFCAEPRCLWRTGGLNGSPCRNHPHRLDENTRAWAEFVAEREARVARMETLRDRPDFDEWAADVQAELERRVEAARYRDDHPSLTAQERNPGMGRRW